MNKLGFASAPANIALLKYWGKDKFFTPLNPSISMTLGDLRSSTQITTTNSSTHQLFIDGHPNTIDTKMSFFLSEILSYFNCKDKLKIDSRNNFPISAGIASSASGYAALCAAIFNYFQNNSVRDNTCLEAMRILGLNGSKSSLRSLVHANDHFVKLENNNITKINNHKIFDEFWDFIICIDNSPKKLSSSDGHKVVTNSVFNNIRVNYAHIKCNDIIRFLENGDFLMLQNLVEMDTILMHASVAESINNFMYLKQQSEIIISELIKHRNDKMVLWTCDAGANVHLIFHKQELSFIQSFIKHLHEFFEFQVYESRSFKGIEFEKFNEN